MCEFKTDYEMMLAVLKNQNEGWYIDKNKHGVIDWSEVKVKEDILNEDGYRYIEVPSYSLTFVFDIEERFVDIINYKD